MKYTTLKNVCEGDIWIVDFGTNGNTKGHELKKIRPVIVIKNHYFAGMSVVAPFTTAIKTNTMPCSILIKKTEKNKLKTDSVILLFQIKSTSHSRFIEKKGCLSNEDMAKVMQVMYHNYFKNDVKMIGDAK